MQITFYTLTHNSLFPFHRHCEERLLSRIRSKRSQGQLQNERATWQSPFTNQLTRDFQQLQNLFTTNSEQGDCFADSATMSTVIINLFIRLRLAMTNVCGWVRSPQSVNSDKRKQKQDFVGCVLRTTTRLATTNDANCKRCGGARSAPYTLIARFV
jgi:hypothetical protein